MGVTVTEKLVQGRIGQLRPFLPARPVRQASRAGVRCRASSDVRDGAAGFVDRRAALLGLLGLGLAADAQAASNPLAQKKDAYTELQSIVKGRGGSGSLLDSLKPNNVNSAVQKGIIAPLTSSPQSAAFRKAPAVNKAVGGPNLEVIGGVAALGVIGAITVSQSGGSKALKTPAAGTQRIGASAKQAAKKVQKAAPKAIGGTKLVSAPPKASPGGGLFGTQRTSGTGKQSVSKTVSKAAPREATQKVKQLQQKAKQLPQKAKQVGRQAGRAAQQAAPGGFKGALKDQDTLANLGAAALVGLGVLAASSVTLGGAPKQIAKPIERAAQQVKSSAKVAVKDVKEAAKGGPQAAAKAAPKDASKDIKSAAKDASNDIKSAAKDASKDIKSAAKEAPKIDLLQKMRDAAKEAPKVDVLKGIKSAAKEAAMSNVPKEIKSAAAEAPKLADKVTPAQAPSLPKLPSPPSPPSLPKPSLPSPPSVPSTPPPVQAEKPKVPSGPDLIPEAVKKPQTPQGPPPPAFPKPSTPSGPSNTFKLPSSSIQDKKPTAAPSKGPTASVAQATGASAPNSNIAGAVVAVAALGLAVAATANGKLQDQGQGQQQSRNAASSATAAPLTPSKGGAGTSDDNSPEGIKKRKDAARKWIDEWRAAQK